jgi:hypothetical protein
VNDNGDQDHCRQVQDGEAAPVERGLELVDAQAEPP